VIGAASVAVGDGGDTEVFRRCDPLVRDGRERGGEQTFPLADVFGKGWLIHVTQRKPDVATAHLAVERRIAVNEVDDEVELGGAGFTASVRLLAAELVAASGLVVDARRQIKRDKGKARLAVSGIFKADDVLVALGAGLQLEIACVDVDSAVDLGFEVVVAVVGAAESFRGNSWGANGGVAVACDDIPIAGQGLFVKGGDLILTVGAAVRDGADVQLPLAEAKVDIGRLVFVVAIDLGRAGVHREPEVGGRSLIGVHVDAAEGGIHLDVFVFTVLALVDMDPAAGDARHKCKACY